MAPEKLQHLTGFQRGQAFDVSGEQRIHKQDLFARFWVGLNDRVTSGRIGSDRIGESFTATGGAQALFKAVAKIMHGHSSLPDTRCMPAESPS